MNFDPERVESELAEIQKQSSPTEARTVILNLLVVSNEETRPWAERALGAVLGKRAARVIHIVETDGEKSEISLSARCYLDHEHKSVCFQEVLIENGSDKVGAAPGSWTPLLIRDIPVYVLWLTPFSGRQALLDHVQEQADKLIIDSEYAVGAGDTPRDIYRAATGVMPGEGFGISDLTWQRMLPLRSITAHLFDPPELASSLFELETVELEGGPPMYGALYLGWLANRLGWQPIAPRQETGGANGGEDRENGPASTRRYRDQQGREVATVHRAPASLTEGLSLTMRFFGREHIDLSAKPDGCVWIEGAGEESHSEAFTVPGDGEMLLAEIDAARNETLYIAAFGLIAR
ncbi:MAG: glucose-6-phosphate dehydrogenase assembly protein OpcA [Spirochaetota bacterium]